MHNIMELLKLTETPHLFLPRQISTLRWIFCREDDLMTLHEWFMPPEVSAAIVPACRDVRR